MKPNSDIIALSLLAAAESAHSFSSYLPSYFTIKKFTLCAESPSEVSQNISDLRSGYKPALLFGLGLSGIISLLAKSALPLILATGSSLLMISQYEKALPAELRKNPLAAVLGEIPLPADMGAVAQTFGTASTISDIASFALLGTGL